MDAFRLAYISQAPVNWCPGLGTVLANEEVTAEGRSDIGNFPVFKRNMKQWMMRITAYSDRLLDDLEVLDWPEKVKTMQRNWIGRSTGASVLFDADGVLQSPTDGWLEEFERIGGPGFTRAAFELEGPTISGEGAWAARRARCHAGVVFSVSLGAISLA